MEEENQRKIIGAIECVLTKYQQDEELMKALGCCSASLFLLGTPQANYSMTSDGRITRDTKMIFGVTDREVFDSDLRTVAQEYYKGIQKSWRTPAEAESSLEGGLGNRIAEFKTSYAQDSEGTRRNLIMNQGSYV